MNSPSSSVTGSGRSSQQSSSLVWGLDSANIIAWLELCVKNLGYVAERLNAANVFPVADSDTGTNMLLTVHGALSQARSVGEAATAGTRLKLAALGALTQARGNSGIIVSEFFRGLYRATITPDFESCSAGQQLAHSLQVGATSAYDAVAQPVEGTILTAARAAALGASRYLDSVHGQANSSDTAEPVNSSLSSSLQTQPPTLTHLPDQRRVEADAEDVLRNAMKHAISAVNDSHMQLSVLARAGVLDAGAYGLVVILNALYEVIHGTEIHADDPEYLPLDLRLHSHAATPHSVEQSGEHVGEQTAGHRRAALGEPESAATSKARAQAEDQHVGQYDLEACDPDGEFELMCLVQVTSAQADSAKPSMVSELDLGQFTHSMRSLLGSLGQSVVVVGGEQQQGSGLWNLHVHTDTPERVLEDLSRFCSAAVAAHGVHIAVANIVVRNLALQLQGAVKGSSVPASEPLRLVVCCSSPRLALDLARAGAIVCLDGDEPVSAAGVQRALTEVSTLMRLESRDSWADAQSLPDESHSALVVSHNAGLTDELRSAGLAPYLVNAQDDAQVVAVTSAVVEAWENSANRTMDALVVTAQRCLDRIHTMRIDHATRQSVSPVVHLVAQNPESIPIVTVLMDQNCSRSLVTDLCDGVERAQSDAEIICLESGRAGRGMTLSIEWAHY